MPDEQHSNPSSALGHVEEWERLALDYLDGKLEGAELEAVEGHLSGCPRCRSLLSAQSSMAALLAEVPLEEPPASLEDAIMQELFDRGVVSAQPRGRQSIFSYLWRRFSPRTILPIAATLLLVVVSVTVYAQMDPGGGDSLTASDSRAAREESSSVAEDEVTSGSDGKAASPGETGPDKRAAGDGQGEDGSEAGAAGSDSASTTAFGASEAGGTTTTAAGAMSGGPPATREGSVADDTTTSTSVTMMTRMAGSPAPVILKVAQTGNIEGSEPGLEELTGMVELGEGLWLGGPTLAGRFTARGLQSLLDTLREKGLVTSTVDSSRLAETEPVRTILARAEDYPLLPPAPGADSSDTQSVERDAAGNVIEPESVYLVLLTLPEA